MTGWHEVLTLDASRRITGGSPARLAEAVRGGADLRILTEFRHDEHIDVDSDCSELVREAAEFAVTYLVDDRWCAGVMSLRQPVDLPVGFGPRPSMSYFLYNQDGTQAIARLHLDGGPASGAPDPSSPEGPEMPKYHAAEFWDGGTNAPSHNFVYDFDSFRYCVNDRWEEVLAHGADGQVRSGSVAALGQAFAAGRAVKVGVAGLCSDLSESGLGHELFVQTGSGYHYTERDLFIAGSHPVIRAAPAIPMVYRSRGWDSGWLVLRTDGRVVYRRCDPYTLAFEDRRYRCPIRWFVSRD